MEKFSFLEWIVDRLTLNNQEKVTCFAPTNIALVKYWGKRHEKLNLPVTSSLSLTLPDYGTITTLEISDTQCDEITMNGQVLGINDPVAKRVSDFLDIFRPYTACYYRVKTENNIPTAAGLASSASGFAALTLGLNELHGWNLDKQTLSMVARLGSGSACRSFWPGFVIWHKGERVDGMDSYGEWFAQAWPGLCLGFLLLDPKQKKISSREAMKKTMHSSMLYQSWSKQVDVDLESMKTSIRDRSFHGLGELAEANALAMHATMMGARPPIIYSSSQTWGAIEKVWQLREEGIPIYFTQDAGPNVKVLFQEENIKTIFQQFPEMYVQHFM